MRLVRMYIPISNKKHWVAQAFEMTLERVLDITNLDTV